MIQYIREFALKIAYAKNTVSVSLRLGSFLNYLRIGLGSGVTVSVSLKFVRFCRPLTNDFKLANEA